MKSLGSGWTFIAALGSTLSLVTGSAQSAAPRHPHTVTTTEKSKPAEHSGRSKSATHHAGTAHAGSAAGHRAHSGTARAHHKSEHAAAHRRGTHVIHRVAMVRATAESIRLKSAFIASAQLRPMAQELISLRSPAAFAGVVSYASGHPGEAAAAAELAIGHAYMLDHRDADAEQAFHKVHLDGSALEDYADYLGAQAAIQGNHPQDAIPLLDHFADRHPGSLFDTSAPILLANAYLAAGDHASALRVLEQLQNSPASNHVDFRSTLAKAYQQAGNTGQAATLYRGIYLNDPLSPEAANAKSQLAAMNTPLSAPERKQHADAMFNAKQFTEAEQEYRALQKGGNDLSRSDRDALDIYAAVCDLRLKKLSRSDVDHLPDTGDDSAALKLYLKSELARNEGKTDEHDTLVAQLEASYPQSRWLEEALYSGGNMYLIRQDDPKAIADYIALVQHFPRSTYAPSAHWHAAWLNYRLRKYPEAARLMDEQIVSYPAGAEIPGALYWRGRLYEDVEHNLSQALNYYDTLNTTYVNSYYANLARQRIAAIDTQPAADPAPALASVRSVEDPELTDVLPENDPHLIKARLLANAALNEYIRPEIQLSDTSAQWGAFAEAEIYQSFGENTRALQAMKRSKIPFFSLPVSEVPLGYWQLVFPRPYWAQLESDSKANGLDPYLVTALIRQESEFNPEAVSRANAYGLMQLLPSVGKSLSKKDGDRHFKTSELLDPSVNLKLGTQDLRKSIDRYNGQVEYALAAYNAGDAPVHQWMSTNNYKDIPEWVESIPYTETREYVEGIVRNRVLYHSIYAAR
jgi:soluble lytic murein transglycosylase